MDGFWVFVKCKVDRETTLPVKSEQIALFDLDPMHIKFCNPNQSISNMIFYKPSYRFVTVLTPAHLPIF